LQVDFILLGGDLFHENNPSQHTMNLCMSLIRKHTMGSKVIHISPLHNDPPVERAEGAAALNYLDSNLNVSIPVFSIHGNHDDPSGAGRYFHYDYGY